MCPAASDGSQSTPSPERGARAARLGVVAALALALAPTLWPGSGTPVVLFFELSAQATADAIRNIGLFLPLGAALAACGLGAFAVIAGALALSFGIELAQLVIPGRDASLFDCLANGVGATLGCIAFRTRGRWLDPGPDASARLALAAALVFAAAIAGTGIVLAASFPGTRYWAGWTPSLGRLGIYEGRVQSAALGDLPLPAGWLADSAAARARLADRAPLRIEAVAGKPTTRLAPVFAVTDDARREILLVGAHDQDVVVRWRRLGTALRLTTPEMVWPRALRGVREGDSLRLELERGERSTCLAVNGVSRCGVGARPSRGWALVAGWRWVPPEWDRIADVAWLATLAFPVGFWLRGSRPGGALAALAVTSAALAIVPAATGLLPAGRLDACALLAGIGAGIALRRMGTPATPAERVG